MQSGEIRERFLAFFERNGHLRVSSASLVPSVYDPTVLLTTAGMQPFKPYFRGEEEPPSRRLTSCQKSFRTTDIENVGLTLRHLTFFEMLGNFSVGEYFKKEAVEFALDLSTNEEYGFGLAFEDLWITVFGGDEELGLGPDQEAIDHWRSIGVPDERIVQLGREDNFWQSGPTGPCGPCSELYYDRGPEFGPDSDRPGDDTERMLEFWNLVFMQYELREDGSLPELPAKNIDTGLGVDRMAAVLQGVPSVFEADQLWPLVELGEELSGRRYDQDFATTRALRVLADHGRAATFLIADGVVPSNEDRGYILRRIMRRTMQQGHALGLTDPFLPKLYERAIEVMGEPYPELRKERETIARWARAEEESFGHTLAQGERMLAELIEKAKEDGTSWIEAEEAFRLHDTYGFPYEMTKELLAEQGLSVDDQGFEELMEHAREVSRSGIARGPAEETHTRVLEFARGAGFPSRYVGYETTEAETVVGAAEQANGRVLAKLEESPFYPEGGGQVSDSGVLETPSGKAKVVDVYRLGDDQALALEPLEGEIGTGESVKALVERATRLATMRNHTATHLLHAALRERLGTHVRQAGSYVGPDKLRLDFTHGKALSPEELQDIEDQANQWIIMAQPVRAITTTLDEARHLGAMALFGEKYGDVVRMVQVGDGSFSRELCGGTHVRTTAEIGVFRVLSETSSAANVRRIEAVTGPEAARLLREHDRVAVEAAAALRTQPERLVEAVGRLAEERRRLEKQLKAGPAGGAGGNGAGQLERLAGAVRDMSGAQVVAEQVDAPGMDALLALADQLKGRLGDAAIVLGAAAEGRVHLVASVAPTLVARGVKAGDVVKAAAQVAGGGGGGRDTMARAGGRDPEKLPDALDTAREAIASALGA